MPQSRIPQELQRKIFELTLALYRVTDFFPPQEALRKHLREKANEIFGSVTEYGYGGYASAAERVAICSRLQSMKGYLELARSLRLVKPINIAVLEREYDAISGFFEKRYEHEFDIRMTQRDQDFHNHNEERQEVTEPLQTWDEFNRETEGRVPAVVAEVLTKSDFVKRETAMEVPRQSNGLNDRQKTIVEHLKTAQQAKISDFYSVFDGISSKTIQRDIQGLVVKDIIKKAGEKRWTVYSLNNVR